MSDGKTIEVEDLEPGMMVDLEGDPFADPEKDDPGFPYEFQTVEDVAEDGEEVRVDFEGFSVWFPKGHRLFAPACADQVGR